jgi:hypothetical protein
MRYAVVLCGIPAVTFESECIVFAARTSSEYSLFRVVLGWHS